MDRELSADILRAGALALALGGAWAAGDWAALSSLSLPDTDDAMRLVQVRDWLGGQAWSDLSQHRLAGGLPLHWTRIGDLGPAALILTLQGLLGRHGAEVAAVVAWPILLFAVAILLTQRLARAAGAPAGVAAVVAALAYPATTIFAPGRIDHHGLQTVLLLGAALALAGPATRGRGAAVGLLAAASLTIGLETAPVLAALGAVVAFEWIRGVDGARARLAGVALGGAAGLVAAWALFAPQVWNPGWCDGLTAQSWRLALAGAAAAGLLAALPERLGRRARLAAAGGAAVAVAAIALFASPRCLSPYGGVDPLLAREWLARVAEAQSILSASPAAALSYLGLAAAGALAGFWRLRHAPDRVAAHLLALQLAALTSACWQLRGAYPAALLGAPALAWAIGEARRRGLVRLAAAWAASAGMLYPIAARAVTPALPDEPSACVVPPALARLPAGVVLAPIDMGPGILRRTGHAVVAAPYHRNNAGNLAALRFERGASPERAALLERWRVRYVVACGRDGARLTVRW